MVSIPRFSFAFALVGLALLSSVSAVIVPKASVDLGQDELVPRWTKIARTPEPVDWADVGSLRTRAVKAGMMRYENNSGVCETTPAVFQASGYADLTKNQHMWWWFFAARNNSASAPAAIWLNGGPGASSMLGLFQENGPCRIDANGTSTSLNPYSWNNNVNMLYIDQPVGVGYSYGQKNVSSAKDAAVAVWNMLQIFYADPAFSPFAKNELALWTESYGGHYGPAFAHHFLQQNDAIANGSISGITLNFKTLGVGNGLTDPLHQYAEYANYAGSNPYRATANSSTIAAANSSFYDQGGCRDQITNCYTNGTNEVCVASYLYCLNNVLAPTGRDVDAYDVRESGDAPYPPDISPLLTNQTFMKKIGAKSIWMEENEDVHANFDITGDWMRNSAPDLEAVINGGVRTVIYDGDADFILNYMGVEMMVNNLNTQYTSTYSQQNFANYTVAGHVAGLVKNTGNFSYIRVFGAGHEVPAYNYTGLATGQASLQFFEQAMKGEILTST
ncbi:hypothetical protein ACEPAH_6438 [Sanghuangporus vaninii]